MAGNVIEYISPPVTNFVDGICINVLSDICAGPELMGIDDGLGSGVWTANRLFFSPLIVATPLLVSQFFWFNGTVVSGETDVGIYNEAGTVKLGSSGPTTNAGVSQIQVVDVANFFLPANSRLWLALGCDNATQTFWRGNPSKVALQYAGCTEQLSGWSTGLPTPIVPAAPTVAVFPYFGFTGRAI